MRYHCCWTLDSNHYVIHTMPHIRGGKCVVSISFSSNNGGIGLAYVSFSCNDAVSSSSDVRLSFAANFILLRLMIPFDDL